MEPPEAEDEGAGAEGEDPIDEGGLDDNADMAEAGAGGVPRASATSSVAVDGVVDALLGEDDWEADAEAAGDAAAPEDADVEAIAAGADFLDTLETLLDEADTLPAA